MLLVKNDWWAIAQASYVAVEKDFSGISCPKNVVGKEPNIPCSVSQKILNCGEKTFFSSKSGSDVAVWYLLIHRPSQNGLCWRTGQTGTVFSSRHVGSLFPYCHVILISLSCNFGSDLFLLGPSVLSVFHSNPLDQEQSLQVYNGDFFRCSFFPSRSAGAPLLFSSSKSKSDPLWQVFKSTNPTLQAARTLLRSVGCTLGSVCVCTYVCVCVCIQHIYIQHIYIYKLDTNWCNNMICLHI